MKQSIVAVLILTLLLPGLVFFSYAAESVGAVVTVTPRITKVGEQVTVTVSLDGYTEAAEDIRGLQVDIDDVDTQVLQIVSYSSLIEDDTADSNTASYNEEDGRLRLAYVQLREGVLAPCTDVFRVVFRIDPDVIEGNSITLPVTVKIQTVSQQITLNSQCTIDYAQEISTVNSVDISWGALSFTYTGGTWNTNTHSYDGAGWTDNGSGFITVKNNGTEATTAEFTYTPEHAEIIGSFTDGTDPVAGAFTLVTGQEKTVYLILSGKPSQTLKNEKVGTVTVQIGGEQSEQQ